MMLVEKSFDTGEVMLNYAEGPDNGPPLLLMHGIWGFWQGWQPVINSVINRWHVYAIDFRGHGKSGRTPNQYRLKDYARDITTFITQNLDEPAVLMGHSLGGMVATMVAGEPNDKAKALVIGDSQLNLDTRETYERFSQGELTRVVFPVIRDLAASDLSVLEIARIVGEGSVTPASRFSALAISRHDPTAIGAWVDCLDSYEAYARMAEGFDCDRLLSNISSPILLIQCNLELGGVLTDKEVEYIKSVHPDVSHVYLEESGHGMGIDEGKIAWVHGPLKDFLESLR
jgi:pimeloyl-ACP methyl ester carboxylesterase